MKTIASLAEGRDNNFNFLRMCAAMLVVYAHSVVLNNGLAGQRSGKLHPDWRGDFLYDLTRIDAGTFGVWVFFTISGFLLARSLTLNPSLPAFFTARALRLFPALIVAVAVTAFGIGLLYTTLSVPDYLGNQAVWLYVWDNATLRIALTLPRVFESNPMPGVVNGALWTLFWEALMYVTLAALGAATLLRRPALMAAWIAGCILLRPFLIHNGWNVGDRITFATLAAMFYSGVAIWQLRHRLPVNGYATALAATLLLAIMVSKGKGRPWLPYISPVICPLLLAYTTVSLAYLQLRWLRHYRRLGDYSYGTYLYGFPLQQALVASLPPLSYTPFFALSMALVLVPAVLSWHLLEERALKLKRRLVRPSAVASPSNAAATTSGYVP